MKKNVLFLLVLACFIPFVSKAQFATGGVGKYTNSIFWLTWYWASTAESGLQSFTPASNPSTTYRYNDASKATISITEGTYVWQVTKYIRVVGVLSNKVGSLVLDKPDSWGTNGFQFMYKGFEGKNQSFGNTNNNQTPSGFDLILNVQVLRNDVWSNIDYSNHGVVFADTESLSKTTEYIECLVKNNSNWYLLEANDTVRASNISGAPKGSIINDCGYKITMSRTTVNEIEYKKVRLDNIGGSEQFGRTAIMYAHGVNEFKQLRLVGEGKNHVAVGYFINNDIANAVGYTGAYHLQELVAPNNNLSKLIQLTGTTKLCDNPTYSIPDAKLTTTVYIGNPPNVENISDTNNNLDGITQSVVVRSNVSTNLTMTFSTTNTLSNTVAYAYVWLDKNNDKKFSADEGQRFTIPANSTNVLNSITYNNLNLPTGDYIFRIRITTDVLEDVASTAGVDERSINMASNGEVTDYILNVTPTPLPLKLIEFEGKATTTHNLISWKTAKESGLKYYELQTSSDGNNWKSIETIAAKNATEESTYFTNDYELAPQKLYRLHIVEENNANNSYSKIVKLERKVEQNIVVYPNPTSEIINVSNIKEGYTIVITNAIGQYVNTIIANNNNVTIPVQNLTKGAYIVTIKNKGQILLQQTIIVK